MVHALRDDGDDDGPDVAGGQPSVAAWATVAYDLAPLDEPAAGNLLVFCSQPQSDVVIDL